MSETKSGPIQPTDGDAVAARAAGAQFDAEAAVTLSEVMKRRSTATSEVGAGMNVAIVSDGEPDDFSAVLLVSRYLADRWYKGGGGGRGDGSAAVKKGKVLLVGTRRRADAVTALLAKAAATFLAPGDFEAVEGGSTDGVAGESRFADAHGEVFPATVAPPLSEPRPPAVAADRARRFLAAGRIVDFIAQGPCVILLMSAPTDLTDPTPLRGVVEERQDGVGSGDSVLQRVERLALAANVRAVYSFGGPNLRRDAYGRAAPLLPGYYCEPWSLASPHVAIGAKSNSFNWRLAPAAVGELLAFCERNRVLHLVACPGLYANSVGPVAELALPAGASPADAALAARAVGKVLHLHSFDARFRDFLERLAASPIEGLRCAARWMRLWNDTVVKEHPLVAERAVISPGVLQCTTADLFVSALFAACEGGGTPAATPSGAPAGPSSISSSSSSTTTPLDDVVLVPFGVKHARSVADICLYPSSRAADATSFLVTHMPLDRYMLPLLRNLVRVE